LVSLEGALVAPPLDEEPVEGPVSIGGFTAPAGAPELAPAPASELGAAVPMLLDVPMLPDIPAPPVAPVLEEEPAVAPVLAEAPVVAAIDEPPDQLRLARSFGEARI
jgi:hypothetical protein